MQRDMLQTLPPEITRLRLFLVDPKTMTEIEAVSGCSSVEAQAFMLVLVKSGLAHEQEIGGDIYYATSPKALHKKARAVRGPIAVPGGWKAKRAQIRAQRREAREVLLAHKAREAEELAAQKEAQKEAEKVVRQEARRLGMEQRRAREKQQRAELRLAKQVHKPKTKKQKVDHARPKTRKTKKQKVDHARPKTRRRKFPPLLEEYWMADREFEAVVQEHDLWVARRHTIMDMASRYPSVTRDQIVQKLSDLTELTATGLLRELVREGLLRFVHPASYTCRGRPLPAAAQPRKPWRPGSGALSSGATQYAYLDIMYDAVTVDDLSRRTGHSNYRIQTGLTRLLEEKLLRSEMIAGETYYSYRKSAFVKKWAEIDTIQETLLMCIPFYGLCTVNALVAHAGIEKDATIRALTQLRRRGLVEVADFNREQFLKLTGAGRSYSTSQGEGVPTPVADIFCNDDPDQINIISAIGHLQPISRRDLIIATQTAESTHVLTELKSKRLIDPMSDKDRIILSSRGRELARFLIGHPSLPNPATYLMYIEESRAKSLSAHEYAILCLLDVQPYSTQALAHAVGEQSIRRTSANMRRLSDRGLIVPLPNADQYLVGDREWMITFEGHDVFEAAFMRGDFEEFERDSTTLAS